MDADRRQYPRTKEFTTFRIKADGDDSNIVTTDISTTGAFFASPLVFEVGTTVTLIARPGGMKVAPIEIHALVVRVVPSGGIHPPGFAVQWVAARSDAGGDPLYLVLKKVLHIREVSLESLGHDRVVEFRFPQTGERLEGLLPVVTTPKGPLLQSQGEVKAAGPPKGPPPVQTPLESIAAKAETLPPVDPAKPSRGSSASGRPGGASRPLTSTTRATTVPVTSRRRSGAGMVDDVLHGAGSLRHRDSDVTQVGARARTLHAKRTETPVEPEPVKIVDDIRVARLGSIGRTRTEKLLDKARQASGQEQGASVNERSQIFGKSAHQSGLGGNPMGTNIGDGENESEHESISVDVPVTYEIDNRFVAARLVQVAPLALEVVTDGALPQPDRNLCINMPVMFDGLYRTIFLMGKLLRVPEDKDDSKAFVFHIERVQEGVYTGAFNQFIADRQKRVAE